MKLRAFYEAHHTDVPEGIITDEELLREFENLYNTVHDSMGWVIPLFQDDHWAKQMNAIMSEIIDDIVLVKDTDGPKKHIP